VKAQGGSTGTFGMLSWLLRGGHIPIFSFLLILSNYFSNLTLISCWRKQQSDVKWDWSQWQHWFCCM